MDLDAKLERAGLDPGQQVDPAALFAALHEAIGEEATVIDRYALEARHRGIAPGDISPERKLELTDEVLAVRGYELLGPASGEPIEVVPYDPSWPVLFEQWRGRLGGSLGETAVAIDHMGSTAVPGLAAKPIIDILVAVNDVDDEEAYVGRIESCGVVLRSRDVVHRYFRPPAGSPRVVQVHVTAPGTIWRREHLLFRDFLRSHPELAQEYGILKTELAEEHVGDRVAYTDMKGAFIRRTMNAAMQWAERTGWEAR